ncbi:MAG: hypothetical protein WCJ37_10930 [Syntrophus sp. (in: bacteria)]
MEKAVQLRFDNVGDNDQISYSKADVVKVCVLGADVAFSFYQIDYQAMANALTGKSSLKPEETKLIPVTKVVMNRGAIETLVTELRDLLERITKAETK